MKSMLSLLALLLLATPVFAAQEDSVPNENATRAKIDKLIKECQGAASPRRRRSNWLKC